jgi:hypothetical protein
MLALPDGTAGNAQNGRKDHRFCGKAYDFAKQTPNLAPPCREMAAFGTYFTDAHGLLTLYNRNRGYQEGSQN